MLVDNKKASCKSDHNMISWSL